NKLHIRGVDAQRKFTFTSGGVMGIQVALPNEDLEIGGQGRVFIGDGGGSIRTGLLIDGNEPGDYVRLHPYNYGTGQNLGLFIPSQVRMGGNAGQPDSTAILHLFSTDKGLLIPRMSSVARNNIAGPATGLLVFQTDGLPGFWFYGGSAWKRLTEQSILADLDYDTAIKVEESADEDIIRFDVGGTERWIMESTRLEPANTGNSLFIGTDAGYFDDLTDNRNTFVGVSSGVFNTSGWNNTAIGNSALGFNSTGNSNVAVGKSALAGNTTGFYNTAAGVNALAFNNTGERNSAFGAEAMYFEKEGKGNSAFGHFAMYSDTAGFYNTAVGFKALYSNIDGSFNVALGKEALYSNTTANGLVAIGDSALYFNGVGATGLEAYFNTAVGTGALTHNTTGQSNSAFGNAALKNNTTGLNNTAVGARVMRNNTLGHTNTAVGYYAMEENIDGNANTALGGSAIRSNTSGEGNTGVGRYSLDANTTGNYNTAIGYDADVGSGNLSNATAVGANAVVSASNSMVLGNGVNVGIGLSSPGNRLDVKSAGGAGTADIVLGLMSPVSKRPVLQFSEFDNAAGNTGMSIEYDGTSTNRLFIRNTNPTRIITFTNDGEVGIGTELPNEALEVAGNGRVFIGDGAGATRTGLLIDGDEIGDYVRIVPFDYGAGVNMDLYLPSEVGIMTSSPAYPLEVNGDAAKPGGGSWTTSSDRRLKQDVQTYQEGLDKVLAIRPVRYRYNSESGYDTSEEYVGVVAQDLREVAPEMVGTFTRNDQEYLSVDNSAMTYLLINAVQEQQQMIKILQQRVTELEALIIQREK
ncbi:MAG: tail fiber domain-containing protein, partial [Saprospiraceae bacterium]|nr:tail fiber domain-containing protein [Saprospiraceae bacterium]